MIGSLRSVKFPTFHCLLDCEKYPIQSFSVSMHSVQINYLRRAIGMKVEGTKKVESFLVSESHRTSFQPRAKSSSHLLLLSQHR